MALLRHGDLPQLTGKRLHVNMTMKGQDYVII